MLGIQMTIFTNYLKRLDDMRHDDVMNSVSFRDVVHCQRERESEIGRYRNFAN